MKVCTFFGHRDCPETIKPRLREVLADLIVSKGVDTFYVGNQGRFDGIVRSVLRELEQEYPEIHYAVVLAYLPGKKNKYDDLVQIKGLCFLHSPLIMYKQVIKN